MHIPLVLTLRELDRGPRKFLFFTCFNVISWQCIAGAVLVLFARHIGMPASGVGVLISFMPLSTVLVLLTFPLVTHMGPKRLMIMAWTLRNFMACAVFVMPWAMVQWGPQAAWYVLSAATLGFCLMRALGSGAWFPWLHELLRDEQRSTFFSAEAALAQFVNVLITLALALVLRGEPGVERYLVIYGIGVVAGIISVSWMRRVPGGLPMPDRNAMHGSMGAYRRVLADKEYMRFLLVVALCFSAVSWLGASVVLYMRDVLGLSSLTIMTITSAGGAGVFLTIRAWARFTDHSGSGTAMYKSMLGHAVIAALFLLLVPGAWWTLYVVPVLVALASIFSAACFLAAHRAMLGRVQTEGRVAYTNLWTFWTAVAGGVTPILAGFCIQAWDMNGFRLCFVLAFTGGLAASLLSLHTVEPDEAVDRDWKDLFSPALPIRTMARILWITVGMHESNRVAPEDPAGK